MSNDEIFHDPENKRFVIRLDGDSAAELHYSVSTDRSDDPAQSVIDFTHTYVPPTHRNKGLAEKLVRHGIAWARERGYRMKASCSYVAKFLKGRSQ